MVSPLSIETPPDAPPGVFPAVSETPVSPVLRRLRSSLPESFQSSLHSAREISRARREEEEEHPPLPTAVPALDRLLDGGLPRGHLVELVGGRSSGRFSALLAALAAATSVGEAAALVDLGDGLDPAAAAALGADLARLLWVRPTTLRQAVAAAEMLLGTGFPLVVLDLGHPPVRGGRGAEAVWLRLARTAKSHDCALLVGSPYRVSGTAAAAVLKAERAQAVWQGGNGAPCLLGGVSACFAVEKRRGHAAEGQSADLELKVVERPASAKPARTPAPRPIRGLVELRQSHQRAPLPPPPPAPPPCVLHTPAPNGRGEPPPKSQGRLLVTLASFQLGGGAPLPLGAVEGWARAGEGTGEGADGGTGWVGDGARVGSEGLRAAGGRR